MDLDEARIVQVLGKRLLVGITRLRPDGEVESLEQFHGIIDRVNVDEGLVLQLPSGEERSLPPDLAALEIAEPGEYRLRCTGELIVDPDFTAMWTWTPRGTDTD